MRLILGSQSFIRKNALAQLEVSFETIPSNFDEASIVDSDPARRAQALAEAKAKAIGDTHPDALVIRATCKSHPEGIFVIFAHFYKGPGSAVLHFDQSLSRGLFGECNAAEPGPLRKCPNM